MALWSAPDTELTILLSGTKSRPETATLLQGQARDDDDNDDDERMNFNVA